MVDPWDMDPNTQAAWRERERRQRSVRLLLMFLLMLLLMDGEEQSTRRRSNDPNYHLRKRRAAKKPLILGEDVYEARKDQDMRLQKATRNHQRYLGLMVSNKGDMENEIRNLAEEELEEEAQKEEGGVAIEKAEKPPKRIAPHRNKLAMDSKVMHYPWNSTGFYRGEWVRETPDIVDDDATTARENDVAPVQDAEKKKPTQVLTAIELETPLLKRMNEMKEPVGVHLLPSGVQLKVGNQSVSKTEELAEEVASLARSRTTRPQTSWFRMGMELNQVVESAEDDTEPSPQVTLMKPNGRVAFQFYSRSVPAMKELSLVDGFIKLYDSSTVGYSTRRDMLLRVKGVMIHSIGRISLVSNAAQGRSALIIANEQGAATKKTTTTTTAATITRKTSTTTEAQRSVGSSGLSQRRRRLQVAIDNVDGQGGEDALSEIRDEAWSLSGEKGIDDGTAGWQMFSSFDDEGPAFAQREMNGWLGWIGDYFNGQNEMMESPMSWQSELSSTLEQSPFEDEGWMDWVLNLFRPSHDQEDAPSGFRRRRRRRRRRLLSTDQSPNASATPLNTSETLAETAPKPALNTSVANLTSVERRMTEQPLREEVKHSKVVFPDPYVRDDKAESVRKTKTPATRRMPARERLLEANAARCEFEVSLNVREVEWTVGEWKTMVLNKLKEAKRLDPGMHKAEPDDKDDEEDLEGGKGSHVKRKHMDGGPVHHEAALLKPVQDQALVMAMVGSIHSPNCDFTSSLNATALRTDWEHTTGKAINYSFYMMLTCLTQIVVLLRQLLHTQAQSAATRVSLTCIGWQTVLDALLCLAHIYLSLAMQPLFTAFASVAFFKLLIFCVIEMKYMAIIIQARNSSNGGQATAEVLRRQIAILHLRFYIALVVAFLAFFYADRTVYILLLYSFWVPQIIQNIITEAKRPLHNYYIYGMSLTRLVAPMYIFAVPNNFLREVYPDSPTNLFMIELLVLWVGIQTAVLIAQGKYGARFMIPARFLPPKYDYSRPIPPSLLPPEALQPEPEEEDLLETPPLLSRENSPDRTNTGTRNRLKGKGNKNRPEPAMTSVPVKDRPKGPTLDCVICCSGIDVRNRRDYMLAPCDHIFHRQCLVQWMDVKMECPICRTELPSL